MKMPSPYISFHRTFKDVCKQVCVNHLPRPAPLASDLCQIATQILNALKQEYKLEGIKVDEGLAEAGLQSWFPDGAPSFTNLQSKYEVDTSYRSGVTLAYPEVCFFLRIMVNHFYSCWVLSGFIHL